MLHIRTLKDTQTDYLNNDTMYALRYEEAFLPIGKKRPHQRSAEPKTHHEIHSRPTTATNSRLRAAKHITSGSPYSHASSIDPGFVEISLACIHTYPHCCCCVACIRFGALFSRQRSFFCFLYCDVYTPKCVFPVPGLSFGA